MSKAPAQRPSAIYLLIDGFELPAARGLPLGSLFNFKEQISCEYLQFYFFFVCLLYRFLLAPIYRRATFQQVLYRLVLRQRIL